MASRGQVGTFAVSNYLGVNVTFSVTLKIVTFAVAVRARL